ncbi:hypothetical protein FCU94_15175 [Vibrio sp. JPW-9-11-11]|nr:hypothetical protein [Vibrio sp. JPW-9-11-11]
MDTGTHFLQGKRLCFKTTKASPKTGFLNKWRTAGVAGNRDSLVEDQNNLIETKRPQHFC